MMVRGMAGLFLAAMVFLVGFYVLAGAIRPATAPEDWESRRRAMSVALTHGFSYGAAAVVILGMGVRVIGLRRVIRRNPTPSDSTA